MSKNNSEAFNRILGWCVAAVIVVAITGGLIMSGSPMKARDLKLDEKRLSNMQDTARVISCYADKNEGELPESLDDIKDSIDGDLRHDPKLRFCQNLKWKTDPVTNVDFEYKRLSSRSFELCGVFKRKQEHGAVQGNSIYGSNRNVILDTTTLRPNAGRHCYTAKNWN